MHSLLFYKHLFPHPVNSGTDANTVNLLRLLSQAFRLHFVSIDTGHVTPESRRFVEDIVDRVTLIRPLNTRNKMMRAAFAANNRARAVLTGTPIGALSAEAPPIRATLRRIAAEEQPDVAVFAYWNAAQLGREMKPSTTVISHLHDAQFMDAQRLAEREDNPRERARLLEVSDRIKRFEVESYASVDRIITQNPEECQLYRDLLPGADIRVFPVLVDTAFYRPSDGERDRSVMLLGNYKHHPNVDSVRFMVEDIWPTVRARVNGATLRIVGRHAEMLPETVRTADGVDVIGAVPDLRPELARTSVFAAPMRTGTGIKIKVLEAMAAGLPVVTTPLGAEAFAAEHGTEIDVQADPPALADAIVDLLNNPARARAMGLAGRGFIERCHDANTVGEQVTDLYRRK